MSELYIDCFAGGGGASTGIEAAIGRSVDIAINHSPDAIALHKVNHPNTKHYIEDVFDVDPVEVCKGRKVGLAWFSPDCKHFSKAKGGKPLNRKVRSLAWVAITWAKAVRPRIIMLENVEEFRTWGPLLENGQPDKTKIGQTFKEFIQALRDLGYKVEWRELRACDYGAPTMRKRLFLIARCDGVQIQWPSTTHAPPDSGVVKSGTLLPWRTASEVIDWNLPGTSIFNRKKPLAQNTMDRIARGIDKFVLNNINPFLVESDKEMLAPTLMVNTSRHSGSSAEEPLKTITTRGNQYLVTSFLAKHYGGNYVGAGSDLLNPIGTITTVDHHALVTAFLTKFYGSDIGQELQSPLHTITTRDRFGLVTVQGTRYRIKDIQMRMLSPRELARATGFSDDYVLAYDNEGNKIPKYKQVYAIGNAVCPPIPEALVKANL